MGCLIAQISSSRHLFALLCERPCTYWVSSSDLPLRRWVVTMYTVSLKCRRWNIRPQSVLMDLLCSVNTALLGCCSPWRFCRAEDWASCNWAVVMGGWQCQLLLLVTWSPSSPSFGHFVCLSQLSRVSEVEMCRPEPHRSVLASHSLCCHHYAIRTMSHSSLPLWCMR
jgi:hypothetical protein